MCRYLLVVVLFLGGCAYRSEDVTFPSGDILLAGSLVVPSTRGPHPAIVFVHGDGPDTRRGYRQLAEEFAKRGIAALVYDKRGCGESGGQWPARFTELAQDAAAGIQFLRTRTDIDAMRIGIWGGSQGGWIAPLAATLPSARVHFVVVKAGTAVGPAELARWKSVSRVARAGHGRDVLSRVNRLMDLQFEILRNGRGWTELHEHVRAATGEKWLPLVAIMRYSPWRSSWMRYGRDIDFDPTATLMRVNAPVLWLLGEKDPETPLRMTIDQLERLRRAGKNITIKVFTGADHQIELPRRWKRRPNYARGYPETMIDWVEAQCARDRPHKP